MSYFINLKNDIFQTDPDIRFSAYYSVPEGTLKKLCMPIFMSQKQNLIMLDYFNRKHRKNITPMTFWRWKKRRDIYLKARILIKKNTKSVPVEWFGKDANFIKYIATHAYKKYEVRNEIKVA